MAIAVPGIVISFRSLTGVVLLKRRSVPSLEVLAKKWRTSPNHVGFWRVSFRWLALTDSSRATIEGIQIPNLRGLKRKKGWKKKKRHATPIEDVIRGCPAICLLERGDNGKWKIVEIDLALDRPRLAIPVAAPKKRNADHRKSSESNERVERRIQRLARPGGSNIGRPWQG